MNVKKVIAGLNLISEGFKTLALSLEEAEEVATSISEVANVSDTQTEAEVIEDVVEEAEEVEEVAVSTSKNPRYTEEDLMGKSYNDLKKLAKSLGIPAVGNRTELIAKIVNGGTAETVAEAEEVAEPSSKKRKPLLSAKASETDDEEEVAEYEPSDDIEEVEDEDAEEDDTEDDEGEETSADTVEELLSDFSDDEIRELLKENGLSTKGKRSALIARVIDAVDDGVISIADEEDEDEISEAGDADSDEADDSTPTLGDILSEMTKPRKKAFNELCKDTNEQFDNGDISREDLIEFINTFDGEDREEWETLSDDELLEEYFKRSAMLVSDDGDVVEEGAYLINGVPYCCGRELEYNSKKKTYYCTCCETEYSDED